MYFSIFHKSQRSLVGRGWVVVCKPNIVIQLLAQTGTLALDLGFGQSWTISNSIATTVDTHTWLAYVLHCCISSQSVYKYWPSAELFLSIPDTRQSRQNKMESTILKHQETAGRINLVMRDMSCNLSKFLTYQIIGSSSGYRNATRIHLRIPVSLPGNGLASATTI